MSAITALTAAIAVVTGFLPVTLILQHKALVHSRIRNELWELRDRVVDDILFDRLSDSAQARELLRAIELQIEIAGRHTLADVWLALRVFGDEDLRPSLEERICAASGPVSEQEAIMRYAAELQKASADHLLRNSALGRVLRLWPVGRGENKDGSALLVARVQSAETTLMPREDASRTTYSELVSMG